MAPLCSQHIGHIVAHDKLCHENGSVATALAAYVFQRHDRHSICSSWLQSCVESPEEDTGRPARSTWKSHVLQLQWHQTYSCLTVRVHAIDTPVRTCCSINCHRWQRGHCSCAGILLPAANASQVHSHVLLLALTLARKRQLEAHRRRRSRKTRRRRCQRRSRRLLQMAQPPVSRHVIQRPYPRAVVSCPKPRTHDAAK